MYQHRSSISETLFSPIHIKTHYQLIYALSITVCFVTKGFKVVLTRKIVFTLLSCHPLILFTISWIANTKKNNKVLNIQHCVDVDTRSKRCGWRFKRAWGVKKGLMGLSWSKNGLKRVSKKPQKLATLFFLLPF